jgi:hypothetical protein
VKPDTLYKKKKKKLKKKMWRGGIVWRSQNFRRGDKNFKREYEKELTAVKYNKGKLHLPP